MTNKTLIQIRNKEISLKDKYYYTYALQSQKDQHLYIGSTDNIKTRMKEHQKGSVQSTKNRRPLRLIYFEACLSRKKARKRENYLKSSWGKRYLRSRIKDL